jgi:hypothetical protein
MAQFSLTFWFAQGKKNLKSVESDSDPSTSSNRSDNDEKLRLYRTSASAFEKQNSRRKQNKPTKKTKKSKARGLSCPTPTRFQTTASEPDLTSRTYFRPN